MAQHRTHSQPLSLSCHGDTLFCHPRHSLFLGHRHGIIYSQTSFLCQGGAPGSAWHMSGHLSPGMMGGGAKGSTSREFSVQGSESYLFLGL